VFVTKLSEALSRVLTEELFMRGQLLLAILNVKSSYIQNIEGPLDDQNEVPDTLQYWVSATGSWRIKTFAIDHDIHTYSVSGDPSKHLEVFRANTLKHYGDVVAVMHEFDFKNCRDSNETHQTLATVGLRPRLEIHMDRYAFWTPDDLEYVTQSRPKE
jgi:hypothetical protein